MRPSIRVRCLMIAALLLTSQSARAQCTNESSFKGKVMIGEFRTLGPGSANDDFVELYNNTDSDITVGGSGWSIFQLNSADGSNMARRVAIPASAVIPARGHYLIAGGNYSLSAYASADLALTTNLANSAGIALFDAPISSSAQTGNAASQTFCANRIDVAGFNNSNTNGGATAYLFFDGGGATDALATFSTASEHSFVRAISKTTTFPTDTDKNSADFVLVSTAAVGSSVLGAPGPENSGAEALTIKSPTNQTNNYITALFDTSRTSAQTPNRCYDSTAVSGGGAVGSLFIRRNLVNNSGASAQLRFRVIDITTVNSPGSTNTSQSIIKPVTSAGGTTNCPNQLFDGTAQAVQDTTLDAPSAGTGGGMNSTLSTTAIAQGSNANVLLRLAAERTGSFRFYFIIEGR